MTFAGNQFRADEFETGFRFYPYDPSAPRLRGLCKADSVMARALLPKYGTKVALAELHQRLVSCSGRLKAAHERDSNHVEPTSQA
jgi:hypothetical protein